MLLLIFSVAVFILGIIFVLVANNPIGILAVLAAFILYTICTEHIESDLEEPEIIREYELMPLVPGTNIYIVEDEDCGLTYRYVRDGDEVIKCEDRFHCEYEEVEVGEKPMLKDSLVKRKRTLWAFPNNYQKPLSILYVPKNSILR